MDQGLAALLGAGIGVVGTLAATRIAMSMQARQAEAQRRAEVAVHVSDLLERAKKFLDEADEADPMTARYKVHDLSNEIDRFVGRHLYGRMESRIATPLADGVQIAQSIVRRLNDDDAGDEWSDEDDWLLGELATAVSETRVALGDYRWPPTARQRIWSACTNLLLTFRVARIRRQSPRG
ncbi:hypothetical protein [Jiangella asiatica]|uniref:Uncharacterized protein n=1 Tax=Jiangella asiatica TaxID=2530372 RepID=A0A4R5DPE9_9ACTN|nr:hypothetical protein [Jiangella asiatica]TDE12633.1 hypothetical protein E1269_07305 [Jiangella asiatica]